MIYINFCKRYKNNGWFKWLGITIVCLLRFFFLLHQFYQNNFFILFYKFIFFITFFNLKTFGFEPKTFPLKEGHSTNRVLYSSFSCFCSYFYSFCLFLCIAQKSLNFCLAFSYSKAREAKEIRIKKRAKVNHSFNY